MALAAAVLAGCGGGHQATSQRAPAGPLTVYLSAPRRGVEARAGDAVAAGARHALADAHGRAGGREIRLVQLDADFSGERTDLVGPEQFYAFGDDLL